MRKSPPVRRNFAHVGFAAHERLVPITHLLARLRHHVGARFVTERLGPLHQDHAAAKDVPLGAHRRVSAGMTIGRNRAPAVFPEDHPLVGNALFTAIHTSSAFLMAFMIPEPSAFAP
jgi:hypothetical protein